MRRCTDCDHPGRDKIDDALHLSRSFRDIAGQFGATKSALARHKEQHLPAAMTAAVKAGEVARADNLLDSIRDLQRRAAGILNKAEAAGDLRTALIAIRECRGNLDLLARLMGELDERTTVQLTVSPEWTQLRAAILTALDSFPGAKRAVVEALIAGK